MRGKGDIVAPVARVGGLLKVAGVPAVGIGCVEDVELAPVEGTHWGGVRFWC